METEVTERMRTLKINGKRAQEEEEGEDPLGNERQSKKKFRLFPSPPDLPHSPRRKTRLRGWLQTRATLELLLELPRSTLASCFVFLEADRVVVATADGGHWSCRPFREVAEERTRAVLRVGAAGGELKIEMIKRVEGHWPSHERAPRRDAEDDGVRGSDTDLKHELEAGVLGGDMSVDGSEEKEEEVGESIGGVALAVLEIAEKWVKIFLSADGISYGESLETTFLEWKVNVSFRRRISVATEDEEIIQTLVSIGFSNPIVPDECRWRLSTSDVDILELSISKLEPGVWNASSVFLREIKEFNIRPASSSTLSTPASSPEESVEHRPGFFSTAVDEYDRSEISPFSSSANDRQQPEGVASCPSTPVFSTSDGRPCKPGYVGLENLGNTCFLNCIIQVLANTSELKEYFLSGRYVHDINTTNPLGLAGEMASAFADVVKALWKGGALPVSPRKLKTLIGLGQSRFVGRLQHDAEELMEFLLDFLHEDLNRVRNGEHESVCEDRQTDPDPEVAASQAWSRHRLRNDSFIADLFQGQFRSELACPDCGKVSLCFDPFSIVQVPIPRRQVPVDVVLVAARRGNRPGGPSQFRLNMEEGSNVSQLLKRICDTERGLEPMNLRALEISESRVTKVLQSSSKVSGLGTILICEVSNLPKSGGPTTDVVVQQRTSLPLPGSASQTCLSCGRGEDVRLRRCTRCFRASYCNQKCQRDDWPRHKLECRMTGDDVGWPFVIRVQTLGTTYRQLTSIVDEMASISVEVVPPSRKTGTSEGPLLSPTAYVGGGDFLPSAPNVSPAGDSLDGFGDATTEQQGIETETPSWDPDDPSTRHSSPARSISPPFLLVPCPYLCDPLSGNGPLKDQGERPLDLGSVRFLTLLWRNSYDSKSESRPTVRSREPVGSDSSTFWKDFREDCLETRLEDCFRLFTEPEILGPEQSWYCARCDSQCQATKELSIWRAPPVLIVHLKRFCSERLHPGEKIGDLVVFPTRGFDISPYTKSRRTSDRRSDGPPPAKRVQRKGGHQSDDSGVDLSPSSSSSSSSSSSTTYDLYGVINHRGGPLGGHYTSFARCYGDGTNQPLGWRLFDDGHVTPCGESEVVTGDAYVLFYRQRRSQDPAPSSSPPSDPELAPGRRQIWTDFSSPSRESFQGTLP